MFSSSPSCMWPSVSCSHAPNNWIKLWSAARLQTITMSAPVQFIDTPRQAWHMSNDISGQAPNLISNLFCYRSEVGGSLTCHLVTGLVSPRPHLTQAHPLPHRTTNRVSTLYTVLLGSTLYTKVWNTPTYKLVINSSWLLGDSGSLEGNLLGIMICSIHGIHSIDIFKTDFSHYLNLVTPDCQIKK